MVNVVDDLGSTPLLSSLLCSGNTEVAFWIIGLKGIRDPNKANVLGQTPLSVALARNAHRFVERLNKIIRPAWEGKLIGT